MNDPNDPLLASARRVRALTLAIEQINDAYETGEGQSIEDKTVRDEIVGELQTLRAMFTTATTLRAMFTTATAVLDLTERAAQLAVRNYLLAVSSWPYYAAESVGLKRYDVQHNTGAKSVIVNILAAKLAENMRDHVLFASDGTDEGTVILDAIGGATLTALRTSESDTEVFGSYTQGFETGTPPTPGLWMWDGRVRVVQDNDGGGEFEFDGAFRPATPHDCRLFDRDPFEFGHEYLDFNDDDELAVVFARYLVIVGKMHAPTCDVLREAIEHGVGTVVIQDNDDSAWKAVNEFESYLNFGGCACTQYAQHPAAPAASDVDAAFSLGPLGS
jgi:hypothetical protein